MKIVDILLTAAVCLICCAVGAMAVVMMKYKSTDPCGEARESEVCDSSPRFAGLGTHDDWIPLSPVCSCETNGVQIYYPIE